MTQEMRTSPDGATRRQAAYEDRLAGRDMTWARTDTDANIRGHAAWAADLGSFYQWVVDPMVDGEVDEELGAYYI